MAENVQQYKISSINAAASRIIVNKHILETIVSLTVLVLAHVQVDIRSQTLEYSIQLVISKMMPIHIFQYFFPWINIFDTSITVLLKQRKMIAISIGEPIVL